ncbi:glycosyl hydrolase family 28-related protein [Paenibacillus sp. GCM10027628]|uniref:glycosyl hydrolase family 28-related protein n=1 Tax=Paenibacillus sp. GCM10027628 TaxID=3273413 RepID=UPI003643E1F4
MMDRKWTVFFCMLLIYSAFNWNGFTAVPRAFADTVQNAVSIELGATPAENGITARAGDYAAGLQTGTLDGKGYWATNQNAPSPQTLYFYMNVRDDFLYDNKDQTVYVTVEYYDKDNGKLGLQYDSTTAAFKNAPVFSYQNTNQWKTYTFILNDAKFANRANGSDFRITAGGGTPEAYIASVTVTKRDRIPNEGQPFVVKTAYPTDDIVIASYNVMDYGAKGDGTTDDTSAFQIALNTASGKGGGIVYAPAGTYKIADTLDVPTGVTLRGDWANPETAGGVKGTILEAYAGKGNEAGTSFIRLEQSSGITNLSIWYPEQSLDHIAAYPWTIEQMSGDSATVEHVTLVNSYSGIKIGPDWNELHYLHDVYGTVLKTGIFLDYTTDIGRIEKVSLSPDTWSHSGLPGAPDPQSLFQYMTAHAEGIVMGRSDWEYMSDVRISGFQTGLRMTNRTNSSDAANAQFYGIDIANCNVALKLEAVNEYGLLVSDSRFSAGVGDSPKAVYATPSYHGVAQFNTSYIGGSPLNAVVNEGEGHLSFENSTIADWNSDAGGYAIVANGGSVILGQTALSKPGRQLLLKPGVKSLNAVNSGYQGKLDVQDESGGADVSVSQDPQYQMKKLPVGAPRDAAAKPKPASDRLYDVTSAPYNADATGAADVSAAVKQALTDAQATGGTVYFPAGTYRINQPIAVPSGVELRGSWDVPHHTIGGGSVIFTNYGENDPNGAPFISLQEGAGIRGLSVYYDQQNWSQIKPYAWTIQGQGHHVYVINTTLVNPYQGIDFGSYDTSGHYIDYVAGSPLKEGIFVGGGARDGFVRNVQFNPHYYSRSTYPNHIPGGQQDVVWNYQKENMDAFHVGHTVNETFFNTFVFGSLYGIHFTPQNGQGPEALIIGHGTDGSKKGAFLEGAGGKGLTFVNTELVAISTTEKVYVTAGSGFASTADFFNSSMWGDVTRAADIASGSIRLQQSNFRISGEPGINATGGDIQLYDSYFQQAGRTHIYAGPSIVRLTEAANLFAGGLIMKNDAPGKVTGTEIKPIALEVSGTGYDSAHPEQLGTELKLTNSNYPGPLNGTIELLEPAPAAQAFVPIRFENVGLGQSAMVKLPVVVSDFITFKVTLEDGRAYKMPVKAGQMIAVRTEDGSRGAQEAISLNMADQYHSLGGKWKGTDDLSAAADVKWDDQNLYISVSVRDDVHVQAWSKGDIWQGDGIQVGLDMSKQDGSASKNVNELGYALSNDGTVTKWRWRAPQNIATGAFDAGNAVIRRTDGLTQYDIKIPFASLVSPGYTYQPGDTIGFSLLLNENDGAGRAAYMEFNQGISTSKDATLFGDLYFLRGSYSDFRKTSAAAAVEQARSDRSGMSADAAQSFINLLPDGPDKTRLNMRLHDMTPPVTTAVVAPSEPDGGNGWYLHPVTVTLSAQDDLSGVATSVYSLNGGSDWQKVTGPVTYSQDGRYTVSYRSTDNAGNEEAVKSIGFNLDSTAPAITVTGLVYSAYSDSMDIEPSFTLSDSLSGVDNSKTTVTVETYGVRQTVQQGAVIPLYTLPLGMHAYIVTAGDLAGNTGSQAVSFQTTTSISSLQALTERFANRGWIDNAGIANSLQAKLNQRNLRAFANEVQAQSGKHIAEEAAVYLLRDAQYLMPQH